MSLAPQPHLTSLRQSAKRSRPARHRRPAPGRRLRLEPLEDRRLLSSNASTDVPKPIPDRGFVESKRTVPDAVTIADINVQLNITPLPPTISIDDVRLPEGNSGTTAFVFTVTRGGNTSQNSSVNHATAPHNATEATDYAAAGGTLNFPASQTTT
jgi:hypothetical protein